MVSEVEERKEMNPQVSIPKARLASFCRSRGIKRLAVFGSALRSDFGPDSDIDLLVEFEQGRTPDLLDLGGMETELSRMFGREVDFVSRRGVEASLNHLRRKSILESTEIIYGS